MNGRNILVIITLKKLHAGDIHYSNYIVELKAGMQKDVLG